MFRIINNKKSFKNNNFIYPLKQEECFDFISSVKEFCDKIIVFGSATRMDCKLNSDIDFAIKTKNDDDNTMRKIYRATNCCKNGCDIVWLNKTSLSEALRKNIFEKGVVIYE